MKKRPIHLSKHACKVLEEFDQAALSHGWEQDQGSEVSAETACERYKKTKHKLELYIARLERRTS